MASVWGELKRRNVVRVALAYGVVTWLLLQLADVLIPLLGLPDWAGKLVFLLLALGFPLALFFAWAYELTPEGIRPEKSVGREDSIATATGRKLDFLIIGVLAIAVVFFAWDRFSEDDTAPDTPAVDAGRHSIAVLPFLNMSADANKSIFRTAWPRNS
jgi:hypothetical protein